MTTSIDSPDDPAIGGLQPVLVWRHFATLCRIPRPSKGEGALRSRLRDWATDRGLATEVDAAGNLIVRKSATAGRENSPGVVLQAHLDMVCQKNADSAHDFTRDPIRTEQRGGWLVAPETTLGADNGMGVALILAALEADDFAHGPLEALFTVDEEAGMGGARGLATEALRGRLMLNLDTEAWGEFYLGCAGGMDVNVDRQGAADAVPPDHAVLRIDVRGLRGGHSGVDIHEERGNAIKLLVRILRQIETSIPLRLAAFEGGSARNALPREACAIVSVPRMEVTRLEARLAAIASDLSAALADVEPGLAVTMAAAQASAVMDGAEQAVWLRSLHASPHGVWRMSRAVPGVVETSNNLGMVKLSATGGHCNFLVRSLRDAAMRELAAEIVDLFMLGGTQARTGGHYPGWTPNPRSPLLAMCQRVFHREFGVDSKVQVIHAGLECGLIAAKYPDMDIVSFGPTIRGAHAPGEAVEIATVAHTWQLLRAVLSALG